MVGILNNWIFFDEQQEAGRTVRFAKNLPDNKVYRWEALTTRLRGYEAGTLRKAIEERNKLTHQFNTAESGVVAIIGPLLYQERFWLGWEARVGKNLFTQLKNRQITPAQTAIDLYPLINSYFRYHQAGLVVGRPDWSRLFRNQQGIYIVDPTYLSYLTVSASDLPLGLPGCRPPESFDGVELNQSGDLFYLGLIIYLSFTGRIPYVLNNLWPTKALLKGESISLVVTCPELNPMLAEMMRSLLNPNPEKRGTAGDLEMFWRHMVDQKGYLATPKVQITNLKQQRAFTRKCWLRKVYKPALAVAMGFLFMIFIGYTFLRLAQHAPKANPLQKVKEFYTVVAGPPQTPINLKFNPQMISDFDQIREHRLKVASELLIHPLAEVQKLRVISQTNHQMAVETLIKQWDWNDGSWKGYQQWERLTLRNYGESWELINRERIIKKDQIRPDLMIDIKSQIPIRTATMKPASAIGKRPNND